MPKFLPLTVISLGLLICAASRAQAENWPAWRGPYGDGTSKDAEVPVHWDGKSGRNIRWSTPIPGEGHSSPIVWQNRIFVTACMPQTEQRLLICIDREAGEPVWKAEVLRARLESKHALNSSASSTPATDGQMVYVSFLEPDDNQIWAPNVGSQRKIHPGRLVIAAYDFAGHQKWLVRPGSFVSAHGHASSPLLYRDKLIINGDHDGDSYLVALDKQSGKEVWRTLRRHKTRSYATPLLRHIDGKTQMVLSGSKCIASFNPDTGKLIWHVEGPTEQFVASMVYARHRFFAVGGYPTHHVLSIRPDGAGDVTDSHVDWHSTKVRCYVPSPVIVDDFLVVADDRGTANAFNIRTGDRLWQTRLGKHFSASLIAAGGLVYFSADDGVVSVVRPGPQPEIVASNELGENVYASPAIADRQLFIRGERNLYCIQEQP